MTALLFYALKRGVKPAAGPAGTPFCRTKYHNSFAELITLGNENLKIQCIVYYTKTKFAIVWRKLKREFTKKSGWYFTASLLSRV